PVLRVRRAPSGACWRDFQSVRQGRAALLPALPHEPAWWPRDRDKWGPFLKYTESGGLVPEMAPWVAGEPFPAPEPGSAPSELSHGCAHLATFHCSLLLAHVPWLS